MTETDPVALTAELVRCASVTPEDDGALDVTRILFPWSLFAKLV